MKFEKILDSIKEGRSSQDENLSYQQIYQKLQLTADPLKLVDLIQVLGNKFSQNRDREQFFQLGFPVIIYKFALLKYDNELLFNKCSQLLNKIFSETPDQSTELEEKIIKYIHKPQYNESLQFYLLLGHMCASSTAAEAILRSPIPTLLVKFYDTKISRQTKNTQIFESLDYDMLRQVEELSGSDSDNSGATMASSLSLDEDIAYKRNDQNPLSARSILSGFANTLLEDDEQQQQNDGLSDRQGDFDNESTIPAKRSSGPGVELRRVSTHHDSFDEGSEQNALSSSGSRFNDDFEDMEEADEPQRCEGAVSPECAQGAEEEAGKLSVLLNLPKRIQQLQEAKNKESVEFLETSCVLNTPLDNSQMMKDSSRLQNKQSLYNETQEMLQIDQNQPEIKRKEILAIAGPLCLPMKEQNKPKFVPVLDLVKLQELSEEDLNGNLIGNRPINDQKAENAASDEEANFMCPFVKAKEDPLLLDQTYINEIKLINQERKGKTAIEDIGCLVGQFIAMSDYSIIQSLNSSEEREQTQIEVEIDKEQIYFEKYFGNQNAREVFDYGFNYMYFPEILPKQDELETKDIERLGIIYVLHVLLRYSPQLTVQVIPSTHVLFTYDMIDMRSNKQGFLPASLLALHMLESEITNTKIILELDEWQNALSEMQSQVLSEFLYINAFDQAVTNIKDKHAYPQRNLTLPSLVFLLERLEGSRRKMIPDMRILATKLESLVRLHKNLSAVEDLPHIIGVIIDRIESSEGSPIMRACAIELLLPSILRLIELLLTKKIKNREFYVFISHKVIQLIAVLLKTFTESRDFQQHNIDQLFIKLLVFDAADIVPWLRRYGYLMLVTSRVEVELSGLFIDIRECNESFEEIRISFGEFCGNLAKLAHNFFYQKYNYKLDQKKVDLSKVSVPGNAHFDEFGRVNKEEDEYNLENIIKIHQLPLHSLCDYLYNQECLYMLQNDNYFVNLHNFVQNKEERNGFKIDFSEYLFLVDFNTGVLMQYILLSQKEIIKSNENRTVYHACVEAIKDLFSIPNFFNIIPKHELNSHIIFHYTSFLTLYNIALSNEEELMSSSTLKLADAHLEVLIELLETGDATIRQEFAIIKIFDFISQQIMFESLSSQEKERNRLEKTSLLPTYRSDDGEETLSNLDFGLDENVQEPTESATTLPLPGLELQFDEIEPEQKECKDDEGNMRKEESNLALLIGDAEEVPEYPTLELSSAITNTNRKAERAFNLITERETDKDSTERSKSSVGSVNFSMKLPNFTSEMPKMKNFIDEEFDSDSDGWGETAARLNIDLGQKEQGNTKNNDVEQDPDSSSTSSQEIPLAEPIQKLTFGLSLNLNGVQEKKDSNRKEEEKDSMKDQPQNVDNANLKMHLVLAKQSSRQEPDTMATSCTLSIDNTLPTANSIVYPEDEENFQIAEFGVTGTDQEVPFTPLYCDDHLHYSMIKVLLIMMINPATGGLDSNYVTQFPTNNGIINIPFILHNHLNSPANSKIVEMLIKAQFNEDIRRLLRLLCYSQFNPQYYDLKQYTLLACGAFGQVYSGNVTLTESEAYQKYATPVAIKLQKLSSSMQDRCVLHDIYQEVTVLERVKENGNFCQLYDYGVSSQGYIIVMHRYYTSFKNFHEKLFKENDVLLRYSNSKRKMIIYGHELSMMKYIRLLLFTYESFLNHIKIMHEEYKVIHFDQKCDNIFIDPASVKWMTQKSSPDDIENFAENILDKHLKAKTFEQLPYSIALSDFGESHLFSCEDDENTLLSKGTEFNKSPEMLVSTNQEFARSFNRRREKGAGKPSDLWSAACTLYEILTNDYLFYDNDWIRFFLRVTSIHSDIQFAKDSFTFGRQPKFATFIRGITLSPEKKAMLGNCEPLIDLLEFELVQDPEKRPTIDEMIEMTEYVNETYFPLSYKFNYEVYSKASTPEKAHPDEAFNFECFDFSIIESQELCMANPQEILAPKCSVIMTDPTVKGTRLSIIKYTDYRMNPADILQNNLILLGSVHDIEDISYTNQSNISTVIDCTHTNSKKDTKITTISHVYRPNMELFNINDNKKETTKKVNLTDVILSLEEVFDVVRCASVKNSAVFIADDTGNEFAASISIACLMEFENMNIYPAVIYLQRIRPTIKISKPFMEFLLIWQDKRTKIGVKMITMFAHLPFNENINLQEPQYYQLATQRVAQANYRCLCGKVFFVEKMFTNVEYVLCDCIYSQKSDKTIDEHGKAIACPSFSCKILQNYYMSLYAYKMHKMLYCYGKDDDFISNWTRATIPVENVPEFQDAENESIEFRNVDNMRCPLYRVEKKDGWGLFICKICGIPTHFIRVEAGDDQRQICVVANISNK